MTIRLTNPAEDRYQRLRLIRWWDQAKLSGARVLVVGAGALGNEVVKNLALLGTGEIYVADFDRIETSNLTRSALFRLEDVGNWKANTVALRAAEINADCRVYPLRLDVRYDLGLNFLRKLDLIFGCLDNREARYYMNRSAYLLKKTFIDGGLESVNGSVTIFRPPETACYECTLTQTDRLELQKRISCLKSAEPEIKQHVPTAPTIASIIGGLQAQIGVRALHQLEIPAGKRFGLYGLSDVFFQMDLQISEQCGLHSAVDPLPESIYGLAVLETDPIEFVLQQARKEWGAEALTWDFERDLIVGLSCPECGKQKDFVGTHSLYDGVSNCNCGGTFKPLLAGGFSGQESWGGKSFRDLGFPADHIFLASTPDDNKFFTLKA
jgi:molybdopterin/thiamine biosynthesis adenylyltransferase